MLSHALRSLGSSRAEGSDLYIYQLGCSESLKSIVTIGSDDAVRTFDWETLQKQSDQTGLAGLASGLTSMDLWQQGGTNREMVVTGARDGHLNIYDLGRSRESAVGSVQLHEQSILAVTAEQNGNSVMVGCELRGGVARLEAWDVRCLDLPLRTYSEVHSDDITALRFHPEYPNQLLSGSTDGTVSLLDLYQSEEDEALLRTVSTGSVQQLHWVSRTDAVVLTHDEKISICPMDTSEAEGSITALVHELGDLREQLSSRYIIKAVHHCGRSLLGSGNADDGNFFFHELRKTNDGWAVDLADRYYAGGQTELVRDICVNSKNVIYAAGEAGIVSAWNTNELPEMNAVEPESKKVTKSIADRYRPY